MDIDGAAGGLTIGPSGSSSIAPPKPKCAAPDSSVSAVSIGAVVDDPLPHRRAPGAAAAA
jgi:hypothetical protein